MKKLLELIKKINLPEDKANHFIVGLYIFMVFGFLFHPVAGLFASICAGILKEMYDRNSGTGTPSAWDAVATSAGGMLGYVCSLL